MAPFCWSVAKKGRCGVLFFVSPRLLLIYARYSVVRDGGRATIYLFVPLVRLRLKGNRPMLGLHLRLSLQTRQGEPSCGNQKAATNKKTVNNLLEIELLFILKVGHK